MAINKPLVVGLAVVALLVGLNVSGVVTADSLKQQLAQNKDRLAKMGLTGNLILVVVDLVFIVCCFPGSFFLELFCGYAYGVTLGVATILIAKSMAAAVCFYAGRYALRDWVKSLMSSNQGFKRFHEASGGSGWQLVLAARLSPLPSYVCSYGFSVTKVSTRDYMLATMASSFPMVVQNVYMGSLAHEIEDLFNPKGSNDSFVKQIFKFGLPLIGTVLIVLWTQSFLKNLSNSKTTKKDKKTAPGAAHAASRSPVSSPVGSPRPHRTVVEPTRLKANSKASSRSMSPGPKAKASPARGRSPAKKTPTKTTPAKSPGRKAKSPAK